MSLESMGGGFEGAVGGMPLSDVVQLKAYNRFTGTLTVEYAGQTGIIYFRGGEIVHAEVGSLLGEQAFYLMIRWPGGKFSVQNGVTAPTRTIENSVSYLLLEAHRLMDEENNPEGGRAADPPTAPASPQNRGVVHRVASVSGVRCALLMNDARTIVDQAGDGVDELATITSSVVEVAHRLGDLFGTGTFLSALFQGEKNSSILFESRGSVLSIGVRPDATIAQVETDIRSEMSRK